MPKTPLNEKSQLHFIKSNLFLMVESATCSSEHGDLVLVGVIMPN